MGTSEERRVFSATQVFFRAASSPSSRRSHSVEHGVSQQVGDSEYHQPPPPPPFPPPFDAEPALPDPARVHAAGETSRNGRMRVRRRSSADHLVFQRDPVAHHNRASAPSPLSFIPTTEEEYVTRTPTSAHFVDSPSASTSSSLPFESPASAREFHPPSTSTFR